MNFLQSSQKYTFSYWFGQLCLHASFFHEQLYYQHHFIYLWNHTYTTLVRLKIYHITVHIVFWGRPFHNECNKISFNDKVSVWSHYKLSFLTKSVSFMNIPMSSLKFLYVAMTWVNLILPHVKWKSFLLHFFLAWFTTSFILAEYMTEEIN